MKSVIQKIRIHGLRGITLSLWGLIFLILGISTPQPALAGNLTVLTEDLPPLNYVKGGVLVGPSIEIVREIQKRVGSHEQIEVYPWARAYKTALEKENVV
jgi:polar amino acid transport system substrate-binding protein